MYTTGTSPPKLASSADVFVQFFKIALKCWRDAGGLRASLSSHARTVPVHVQHCTVLYSVSRCGDELLSLGLFTHLQDILPLANVASDCIRYCTVLYLLFSIAICTMPFTVVHSCCMQLHYSTGSILMLVLLKSKTYC
jgi:hypothetical protein